MNTILKEMHLFQLTGRISPNLKLIENAIFTIRPTSTQNERNFAISGHLVSEKRTRLSDGAVDIVETEKQGKNWTEKKPRKGEKSTVERKWVYGTVLMLF